METGTWIRQSASDESHLWLAGLRGSALHGPELPHHGY